MESRSRGSEDIVVARGNAPISRILGSSTLLTGSTQHNLTTMKKKLYIETNSIQGLTAAMKIGEATTDHSRSLKRVFLSNRTVTCNDGSQAGFYLRKSPGSKKWIVFLEGGWHCYDTKTCRARWMKLRHLMTSTQWPETRDGKFKTL